MQWFSNLRIAGKLIVSILAVLALTAALGAICLTEMGRMNTAAEDVASNWLPSIKVLGEIQDNTAMIRRKELMHVILMEDSEMLQVERDIDNLLRQLGDLEKTYEPMVTAEEKEPFGRFRELFQAYLARQREVLGLSRAHRNLDAQVACSTASFKAFTDASAQISKPSGSTTRGRAGHTPPPRPPMRRRASGSSGSSSRPSPSASSSRS
jgi:methyl-accepting chemotaxis protein